MGQNGITWGQDDSTGMTPEQKVNKAEEPTYISLNIWLNFYYLKHFETF